MKKICKAKEAIIMTRHSFFFLIFIAGFLLLSTDPAMAIMKISAKNNTGCSVRLQVYSMNGDIQYGETITPNAVLNKTTLYGLSIGRAKGGPQCNPTGNKYTPKFDVSVNLEGTNWYIELSETSIEIYRIKNGQGSLVSKDPVNKMCKPCQKD